MFCYNYDVHRLRSKVLPSLLNKFLPSLGELLAEFVSFSIPPKNSTSHLLMIVSCRDAYNEDQWILVSFWFHIRALYHLFVQPPLKKRNKHPVSLLNLTSSQGTSQTFMDTRNATDLATRTSTILDRPSLDVNMCFFVCFFQGRWVSIIFLGAPKRKRRNARSGSHDTIAGPERNWKGWCFGVMINTNAFTGPRKTHPQVGQYVFPIFHCKGVGCVYISSENAFDKSALLVDRNKLKQYQNWMKTSLGWSSYWAPG